MSTVVAIVFVVIGLALVALGGLAGIFLLRWSVGLWTPATDPSTLKWMASFCLFSGAMLILLAAVF